jgi:hypothetical protein
MVQELRLRLAERFPDLTPEGSLTGWAKGGNGVSNTLKLKKHAVFFSYGDDGKLTIKLRVVNYRQVEVDFARRRDLVLRSRCRLGPRRKYY